MAFQKAFTPFLLTSIISTFLIRHSVGSFLSWWCLPLLAVLLLLFLYAIAVVHTVCLKPFFSPLRHLPKAPQPPIWHRLFKEPSAHHFEKWFREVPNDGLISYRGILNMERVLVTSSTFSRQILQTQAYSYEKQYGQRTHLERVGGRGLVWHEGNAHRYLRRALEPAFKSKLIKDAYFAPIAQKTEEMLRLLHDILDKESTSSSVPTNDGERQPFAVIELDEVVHRTVFDIMGLVAFGPDMDFQSIFRPELYYDPLKDYRLAFKPSSSNRLRVYTAFFLPTWVVNWLPIRFNATTALAIRRFRQIGKGWVDRQKDLLSDDEKKQGQINPSYIMQSVIAGGRLSDQDLLEQFSMLQAGGIHSTGAAIMSTLWWLAKPENLDIQRRLRDEIRAMIPSPDPRTWSSSWMFESCHYLNAVISEVLRLHPPFSWLGRTPNRWVEVGDTPLPPGLSISLSPWAAHRDPKVWGEDADVFRPERWLPPPPPPPPPQPQPSPLLNMSQLGGGADKALSTLPGLLTFGGGPRKCIADVLARMELQCVLAALFGQYEFEAVPSIGLPGVTHQSTLAFRADLRLRATLIRGWGEAD